MAAKYCKDCGVEIWDGKQCKDCDPVNESEEVAMRFVIWKEDEE